VKKFNDIYRAEEEKKCQQKAQISLVWYVVIALLFVGLCTMFVLLYVLAGLSLVVCFLANVGLTIVFCWLSVLFFTVVYARKRAQVKFFQMLHHAQFAYDRGTFGEADGEEVKDKVVFKRLRFTCADGEKVYLVKSPTAVPFAQNAAYDLQVAGDYVVAYAEAASE
jgi:hypothetical protein